ncbi:20506_t:CDS:2, partial [Dentiscutata erythropus]
KSKEREIGERQSGNKEVGMGKWKWESGCGEVSVEKWVWESECGEVGVGIGEFRIPAKSKEFQTPPKWSLKL